MKMGICSSDHLIVLVLVLLSLVESCLAQGQDSRPAIFAFGDSLVDAGNNNYIATLGKANKFPYGIDLIDRKPKPTGRFTNGRTAVDILGQELGIKDFIPPYLDPSTVGDVVFHGVNYASGGAGILSETGSIIGDRITMDEQLDNFANTRQYIFSRMGDDPAAASKFMNKAIYSICIGSDDFLLNYLLNPILKGPPQVFIDTLISTYRLQLIRLYNLGARKIVIVNVPPIGCTPALRDLNPLAGDSCVAFPNRLAAEFNNQLKSLVMDELSSNLVGSRLVYADIYGIFFDILDNFQSYGFENPDSACCHLAGRFGGLSPCIPISRVCRDRSGHIFWDPVHPTEATYVAIAKRLLDGDSSDVYPINIRQLFYEA